MARNAVSNLHSANAGASNRSFYRNPEADKLIEASQLTIDQDERLELLHQANLFLMEDVAMVPLWHQVNTIAMRERVTGLIQGPTGDWELYPVDVR